ncbi:polymorphic toxin type 8 domain-containing protein [Siminovitchia fortis]|nr:polymorphic toxin type 8 domain-containing protein [Siminovitchia fortis]WHY83721.1 polymorphic toxin type 8 domain-containing protein [Siminovitchia fortis]
MNKHSGNTVTATYYYHYNPRGDVIALTDQSGNVIASYSYDSCGNPLEVKRTGITLENPFRYAGYQYDEETGLYYLMARYYHPTHGVFLSMDPDPGDDDDILTQNGYTYANNNPIMMVDPDGKWFWLAVNAGFAAYDGYKAYRAGKGWKGVAGAAASNFGPGKVFKGAKKVYRFAKGTGRQGKQAKLRSLINDPKQPKHVRGWIRNEKRHIKNGKRKNIRVPIGYELAHKRSYEARKGASYKHSSLQVIRNHRLQHFYDGYGKGRKNKNVRWKYVKR